MDPITSPDGTPVSPLAFGTMQFGGRADPDEAALMYRACREHGVTMFDTAPVYADGRAEEILGRLIADDRDGLIVATKSDFTRGNGRTAIAESCEASRARLGIDRIDLFYLHRFDPETPLPESFEALAALKSRGHIRRIGVSNFAAWQVMKAQAAATAVGLRIDAIQPMLNLVKRQAEVELLPMARDQGMSVFPYSPLGGGLLTGKYRAGMQGRLTEDDAYRRRYGEEWMHNTAADLKTIALQYRTDPETLAVAWAMRRPGVTAPILGARSLEQLLPSLAALSVRLDDALYARITALGRSPATATDRSEEA